MLLKEGFSIFDKHFFFRQIKIQSEFFIANILNWANSFQFFIIFVNHDITLFNVEIFEFKMHTCLSIYVYILNKKHFIHPSSRKSKNSFIILNQMFLHNFSLFILQLILKLFYFKTKILRVCVCFCLSIFQINEEIIKIS